MGARVGWGVGLPAKYVGASEGLDVGILLGADDGDNVTGTVEDALGEDVGLNDGAPVDAADGTGVGLPRTYVGVAVGTRVGLRVVGFGVGAPAM